MAINKGVAPADMNTDVGKLRAILGDLEYVELTPPEAGFGDYRLFGDAELTAFLETGGSIEIAAYFAYMNLAASAAMESKTVKDFDLSIDLTKRATDLRLIAADWRNRGDALAADIFELFDVSIDDCSCPPELAARSVCQGGCRGVQLF